MACVNADSNRRSIKQPVDQSLLTIGASGNVRVTPGLARNKLRFICSTLVVLPCAKTVFSGHRKSCRWEDSTSVGIANFGFNTASSDEVLIGSKGKPAVASLVSSFGVTIKHLYTKFVR